LGGFRKTGKKKMNTRRLTSIIHVTIVVLLLSACGTVGTVAPTPEVMSDCFQSFKVAAWQDLNGDGRWDVSEPPLEGVQFDLRGIFAQKWGPDPDSSKGKGWFTISIWSPGACIKQEYTITAIPPESYEPTTPITVTFSDSLPFEAQFGFHAVIK
jgi:hypothetical protein